jgi:glucose/arabinose dehydrogenase
MVLHPETRELRTAEHGPSGGDVLHVVDRGRNYGWPIAAFGGEYSTGEMIGVGRSAPGVEERASKDLQVEGLERISDLGLAPRRGAR